MPAFHPGPLWHACLSLALCLPAAAINYEVYPGSAFYLPQMLDRSQWAFVASRANGLYHHPVGFGDLSDAEETTYTSHFTNRFAMVEGDMGSGSTTGDVANLQRMTALGLAPVAAFVNRPSSNLSVWRQLVRNNAAQGAPSYEMLAPHRLDDSPLGWYDPIRDYARANMLVAGCIGSGVDAPVYLYVNEGTAYRQTIYDLRDWSVANGRRFNYLISPNNSYNAALLADTLFTVRDLEDQGHEPDVYGVVLYGERPVDLVPEKTTVNGVDQPATTITGLAYYLIKHRDGEPGTLDLSALRSGTDHAAGVMAPTLSQSSQSVALPVTGPSSWTLRMSNTSSWLDYAGVLRARTQGAAGDWSISFSSAGTDVTSSVLSERGRKFLGSQRWMPGTTRTLTMTATPLVPNPGNFKLVLEALPHGMIDHALDVMAFTSGAAGNSAPTLALEARPRVTREALPLGPLWFTCGDAETVSTALSVSATSSNPALVPNSSLVFGQNDIQRWLRVSPVPGQWGQSDITVTVGDGALSTSKTFTLIVERTTVLPVVKANNTIQLENGPSWSTGAIPGFNDQAVWDSTVTTANSTTVSAPLTVAGLRVTNPGGNVSIHAASALSLGVAGVDLSSSTRDLSLSGSINLDESATWSVNTNRLVTVAGGLSGFGGLAKSGNGRLELLGNDSFAAALSISAGELVKSGSGTQSSTSVSGNGILRVSHSGAFGAGGLSISAANSSTGRVEISGGISVLAGRTATINTRSSNTDAVVSNGNNSFGATVSISTGGSLCAVASNAGHLELAGGATSIATGNRNLTLRGTSSGRLSGSVNNGSGILGVIKSGTGSWTLDGVHSFTGPVSVQQGHLGIHQALPTQSVSVSAGALITGDALLGGEVSVFGTHSPGDGVGTQTISGNLTYNPGSRILWEIGGQDSVADSVNAATVVMSPNVIVDVVANPPGSVSDYSAAFWNVPRQWQILTASSLSGAPILGSVSADASGRPAAPFGSFTLQSSSTAVILVWEPSPPYDRWAYSQFALSWNDPQISGPSRDPDGDGISNRNEWIFGTGAADSTSRFATTTHPAGLSFVRAAGRIYQVQSATSPTGPWIHHADVPAGTGPVTVATSTSQGPRRFYRLKVSFNP